MKKRRIKKRVIGIITMVLSAMILSSCGSSSSNSTGTPYIRGTNSAFIVTSDYTTGSYSAIDLDTLAATNDIPSSTGIVHSDCGVKYYNNKIYIVNRLGMDNITVLDIDDPGTAVAQFSVGNATNPYDIAFVSDTKAYVALYGSNDLLVIDPTDTGDEIKQQIDLSPFIDAVNDGTDGLVEAGGLVIIGDKLFVALHRIDRDNSWANNSNGVLVVVDIPTNMIIDVDDYADGVQGITLTGKNPKHIQYYSVINRLIISEKGDSFTVDGGIETVNPDTYAVEGFFIDESDELGSAIGDFVIINDRIFITITTGYNPPTVMEFDFDTTTLTCTKVKDVFTAAEKTYFATIEADGFDRLIILDRNPLNHGVRFYDYSTEVITVPVNVGLQPSAVVTF